MGVTDFVSEIKRVENHPDFEKFAHVIRHGLHWFIVLKNIGEPTEAIPVLVIFRRSGSVG